MHPFLQKNRSKWRKEKKTYNERIVVKCESSNTKSEQYSTDVKQEERETLSDSDLETLNESLQSVTFRFDYPYIFSSKPHYSLLPESPFIYIYIYIFEIFFFTTSSLLYSLIM